MPGTPDQKSPGSAMLIVLLGWVFFRSEGLVHASEIVASMAGFAGEASPIPGLLSPALLIGIVSSLLVVYVAPTTQVLIQRQSRSWTLPLQLLFVLALTRLVNVEHVPFLYFQF